jgi:nitrate reductase delta subunit
MSSNIQFKQICTTFAEILEYPDKNLLPTTKACIDSISMRYKESSLELQHFLRFLKGTNLSRLEEIYIGTFELNALSYLYAGYHIFGNSPKRGAFLSKLKERYSLLGISSGNELPDHFPVLLRFSSKVGDSFEEYTLSKKILVPSLEQILNDLRKSNNPYASVISALLHILRERNKSKDMIELTNNGSGKIRG